MAATDTIHVDIVSAEGEIFSGPAKMVFLPASEGEIEGEKPDELVTIYDVWVDAKDAEAPLDKLCVRLAELKEMACELLPSGLQAAAQSHASPQETLKLIAQLAE